jgi:hypothetical protein
MYPNTTEPTEIDILFSTADGFGFDDENLALIDLDASIASYVKHLQADLAECYPDAKIEIEWTSESLIYTRQTCDLPYLTPAYDDCLNLIQSIREDLYGNFERWVVMQ